MSKALTDGDTTELRGSTGGRRDKNRGAFSRKTIHGEKKKAVAPRMMRQ